MRANTVQTKKGTDFGGNSDAALPLEADGVHSAFMWDIGPALAKQTVHECGLAVVDMGYDGNVAEARGVEGGVRSESGVGATGGGS